MAAKLQLFCLADGESTSNAFSVKIPTSDTVDNLKKLIKIEKSIDFGSVDADKLTLWQVSIPAADDIEDTIVNLDLVDKKEKFDATTPLSKLFSKDPAEETILFIVHQWRYPFRLEHIPHFYWSPF
ncbi:hypothetical protein BGX26_011494 [Mortierella sp. AD094]|nr:hypothetical protein BGX26_011494 [Mortierella sp. AD094]